MEECGYMKVLFMHNAIPEYRIPWFKNINQSCDAKFVFTNYKLTQKLYHFDIDYQSIEDLDYLIMGQKRPFAFDVNKVLSELSSFDFVEFPPTDSFKEFVLSFLVLIKCKKLHIKTGYFWEKWEAPLKKQPLKRRLINFLMNMAAGLIYKHTDMVFAGSQSSKAYFISRGVKNEKIVVLPDACETPSCEIEDLRKKYDIGSNKKVILYFGRLLVQKGLHILIEALNELPNKNDYVLIVAGDGENREQCEKLIAEYKLENVIICGWVNPYERLNYFQSCDIFVFPGTFYEGRVDVWGLTLVEAIQNRKIVISTTAVGSAKDLIKDGINGYLLNAENDNNLARDLADAITKCDSGLKDSAEDYDEKLSKSYSFSNMAKVYMDAISEICK